MVKFRMKTQIMAAITFLVMSAAVILGGYDMQNAEATGGTDYVKYTFATGQTQTYTLPEISTVNYANTLSRNAMTIVFTDTREPYYDSAVVAVNGYDNSLSEPNANYLIPATGFIIGDHEIMTAAHCIYNSEFREYHIDSANVIIPDTTPYTNNSLSLEVVSAHVPQDYIDLVNEPTQQGIQDLDYAILTVEEDLSNYGCYLLGMGTDSIKQKNVPIHSLGYAGRELKISHGSVINFNNVSYDFNILSDGGSSGGPIYVESMFGVPGTSNEDYQVRTYRTAISIVSNGNNDSSIGNIGISGVRIRPIIMQFAYDNDYL